MLKFAASLFFTTFFTGRTPSSASLRRLMRDCDNDGLAQCLGEVDADFYACEKDCQNEFPDDAAAYHRCRDQCREIHDGVRQECFKQYCPKKFEKYSKRPKRN